MKKLIIIFSLLLIGVCQAQSFKGFFKPLDATIFEAKKSLGAMSVNQSVWLFRPTVEITAVALTWNKTTKKFDSSPLSSVGPGIGFRHYIDVNGAPYNNYGFNLIALLGYQWSSSASTSISTVGTFNFLEFLNVGAGYNFTDKQFLMLLGTVVKF